MATTIAFFDITTKERESFSHYFTGPKFDLKFFDKPINQVPVYDYKDTEVVSVYVTSQLNSEIVNQSTKLKLITTRATGTDNIDIKSCTKHNVTVCNVPAYGQTTVAEYAIMLMLLSARKFPQVLRAVQERHVNYPRLTGHTLHGKTLGVVGTGKIGLAVIEIAKAIGMHVVAYDPYENAQAARKFGFSYVKLDHLLSSADIVSLHCPMSKENTHIIDESALNKMKDRAILVNTARGELVDTKALLQALKDNKIAGTALDVIEGEQMIDIDMESSLFRANKEVLTEIAEIDMLSKMKNVILSPHNAFNSQEALHIIRHTTAQNIQAFLDGKPQNVVSNA